MTLGVILAFVVFRAVNRDELEVDREAIDYLVVVEGLQESDLLEPVYPPTPARGLEGRGRRASTREEPGLVART